MYQLAPSILAADFTCLGEQIKMTQEAGSSWLHFDVMDGQFVPSISFGMPVLSSLKAKIGLFLDVHLMIEKPERYIEEFAKSGADMITVHQETCVHLDRTLAQIHEAGCKAGIALNPATPLHVLEYVLEKTDMVLIMTVNPGFGGQKIIPYCTEKIRALRSMILDRGLSVDIEVDGGINISTLPTVLEAGANVIVAGSSVFTGDITKNTKALLSIMDEYNKLNKDCKK